MDTNRNPVTYLDDTISAPRTCRCGCGVSVFGQRLWAPGHDARALADRVTRQWGSTAAFLDWFDQTYPPDAA